VKIPFLLTLLMLPIFGCGRATTESNVQIQKISAHFQLTKGDCPFPTNPPVQAKLIVETLEKTPCPLTVDFDSMQGEYLVHGDCPNIPTGKTLAITLDWFVNAPTTNQEILVGESVGSVRLDLPQYDQIVNVVFTNDPQYRPKTKAKPDDPPSECNRFNCDRAGVNSCDGTKSSPNPNLPCASDVDTCSNLEELCKGTLFADEVDKCP